MTISQSKIEEIKKCLPGGAGQRDLSKNAIKKGHGLKTVVSDFLPEVLGPKRQVHSTSSTRLLVPRILR
jgi:hypothetical protein